MAGFDCSGLIVEILQAVGLLAHRSDYDAGGLWDLFKTHEVPAGYSGCLVFWFNAAKYPMHIEIMLDDSHTIGASGGGNATTSLTAAIQANAFIKIRPITYRGPGYRILDPFLEIKENE